MDEVLRSWAVDQRRRGLAPGTILKRSQAVRATSRALDLWSASSEDIEAYLDSRGLSLRTRYVWLSHLSVFYGWAMRRGLCHANPAIDIERPKVRPGIPRPITDDDLRDALAYSPEPVRSWLILMALAGLRCCEVCAMCGRDLVWVDGVAMLVVHGKGGKERIVPAHPLVETVMRRAHSNIGPMWRTNRGTPLTAGLLSTKVAQFLRSIGIDATAHQLRHWFATNAYATSARDLLVVQQLLGHSSPQTTAVYTRWSRPDATAAVMALRQPEV